MKYIKYPALIIFLFSAWILLNSIDDSSYNDLGIHDKLVKVQATENGYQFVSYLNDPDFKMFESNETYSRFQRHIQGKEWEQPFVDEILEKKSFILEDIESATQKPFFKFPDFDSENSLPRFVPFRNASRLLLLESKNHAKAGDFKRAIEKLTLALAFGQLIKSEENSTLFSYTVGMHQQMSVVGFANQFSNYEGLNDERLNELQNALDEINEYHADGFTKVFWGEYAYTTFQIEEEKRKSLRQRLDAYKKYNEFLGNEWGNKLIEFFGFQKPGGNQLLRTLLPKYYFHPNEFLTNVAPEYIKMAEQTNAYYKNINFPEINSQLSWLDTISPNSMTQETMVEVSFQTYRPYFKKRCLTHVYFDALRTVIAIRRYRLAHGKLPENLEILVPQYLKKLPVDYFDGSVLKYSKEDSWLYSIGINLKDDGGSSDSFIGSDNWRENPTIPVSASIGSEH